jgi:hypothetical protein
VETNGSTLMIDAPESTEPDGHAAWRCILIRAMDPGTPRILSQVATARNHRGLEQLSSPFDPRFDRTSPDCIYR